MIQKAKHKVMGAPTPMAGLALGTGFTAIGGPVYMAVAVVLNALFLRGAWRIWRRDEDMAEADNYAVERGFFRLSLLYLALHFAAILAEAVLRPYGLGGWG